MAGKAVTVTLPPNTYEDLCKLETKKGIKKSAIITLAIEQYKRVEERAEKGESNVYK